MQIPEDCIITITLHDLYFTQVEDGSAKHVEAEAEKVEIRITPLPPCCKQQKQESPIGVGVLGKVYPTQAIHLDILDTIIEKINNANANRAK